jgi:hypothetical protein
MMHPYWINVKDRLGVGITVYSDADAVEIFARAFGSTDTIVSVEVIKDVNDLDQNHVVPNMGNWFRRGIWFPLGYDLISN